MSGCDPVKKRLSAYLDDEVPLPERRGIEDHLAGCAACRTFREELARATQVLASSPEPHWNPNSTDALIGNLRAKLARERPVSRSLAVPPPQPAGTNWRALAIPLAAVFLIVAVPGLWIGVRSPESGAGSANARAPKSDAKDAGPKSELAAKSDPVAREAAAPAPQIAPAQPAARQLARADEPAKPTQEAGALAHVSKGAPDAGAVGGKPAARTTLASATVPAKPAAPHTANLAPRTFPGIDLELAELERRMAAVEREVSSFTTAARQQAQRESSQVASRRFATWR